MPPYVASILVTDTRCECVGKWRSKWRLSQPAYKSRSSTALGRIQPPNSQCWTQTPNVVSLPCLACHMIFNLLLRHKDVFSQDLVANNVTHFVSIYLWLLAGMKLLPNQGHWVCILTSRCISGVAMLWDEYTCDTLSPTGLGYCSVWVSWLIGLYYNVIIAHVLFYLAASFTSELPWQHCNHAWNSPFCRVPDENYTIPGTSRIAKLPVRLPDRWEIVNW